MLRKMALCLACVGAGLVTLLGTNVSVAGGKTVMLMFSNGTDGDTELFWLDSGKGKELSFGVVPKGKNKTLDTYKGHVWIVRTTRGEELARYTVNSEPGSGFAISLQGPQADLVRRSIRSTDSGSPGTPVKDLSAIKAEMIRLTNAERAKAKLPPLVEDARLTSAAQKYTDLMAEKQTLSHNIGGTKPGDRVNAEKYNWRVVDEIITRTGPEPADAARAIQIWMSSTTGHRDAILDSTYTNIGVGVKYGSNGAPYYTEIFARPQ
jgi:uncharacterized protein YkwD